jgi:hypothetical protein
MAAGTMTACLVVDARPRAAGLSALLAALLLGGCAGSGGMAELLSGLSAPQVPPPAGSVPAMPRLPMDPLAAFAMANPPGHQGSVEINGVAEPARVLRAYNAASGLECREMILGSFGQERAQLACGDASGYQMAQPLLRGSGRR